MRYLLIISVLVLFQPGLSYAFDFGDLFKKEPAKEEPAKTEPPAETSSESGGSKSGGLGSLLGGAPVEEEVEIGREIAGRLLGAAPLVDDAGLQNYINRVGTWLAMQSGRKDLEWHFGVIEAEDINAFAAPGGYIFITKGLYKKLNNEAELAGVLAHEIGHVIKKHHLKILKQGQAIDTGRGFLSSKIGGGTGSDAMKKMLGSGAEIMARGLDKEAEYEADRIGVVVATRGGYDSYGLPTVLQEIGHASSEDSSVELLFKTHPHPDARLTELEAAMGEKFDRYEDGKLVEERFYKIK